MSEYYDLVVLVADMDAYVTIETLLNYRYKSLEIPQLDPSSLKMLNEPNRDAGTFKNSPDFLRPYLRKARFAMVLLDREGSGKDQAMSAEEIEADIEKRLIQTGWTPQNCRAIVFDPELEIWVWSKSPNVLTTLSITSEQLDELYKIYPRTSQGKPERPKEAMLAALKMGKKRPFSPDVFKELASTVSLKADERAFNRFKKALQGWFPLREA